MKLKIFIAIFALAQFSQVGLPVEPTLHWKLVPLAVDANEGIDIADFNGDGKPDVAAGRFWYQNPEFRPRPLRNFKDVNGYVESNGDFAYDVDADGVNDVIAGGFFSTEVPVSYTHLTLPTKA